MFDLRSSHHNKILSLEAASKLEALLNDESNLKKNEKVREANEKNSIFQVLLSESDQPRTHLSEFYKPS